jgi:Protein of unknown function (DUF935)
VAPDPQAARIVAFPDLKPATRRDLMRGEIGTEFDQQSRMFGLYSGGNVFDYGQWTSRDMAVMLTRDGQAAALEAVLTLPIRQASRAIEPGKHDAGEADLCHSVLFAPATAGGMKTPLQDVIGQVTSAQIYKKSFHELVWHMRDKDGAVALDKIAFRPTATCEMKRNARTGASEGFRQQQWLFGGQVTAVKHGMTPGWADIPKVRSLIHINGKHREPLTGTSELDLCYWVYQTKLKLLFLWYQFLEQQSLPKVIVYGENQREASAKADDIASLRSSGVVGFARDPQGAKSFEILASDGKGAQQFADALSFLETWQTASVLAGFTGLSSLAAMGRGSLALSQDQSAFFLKSRQAISLEIAQTITHQVIAPLVTLNFGPGASYPRFEFGALTDESATQLVALFQAMSVAPALQVPPGILDIITERMATVLNLDVSAVTEIVQQGAKDRSAQAAAAPPAGMLQQAAAQLGHLAGGTAAAAKIAHDALVRAGNAPQPENLMQPYDVPVLGVPKA